LRWQEESARGSKLRRKGGEANKQRKNAPSKKGEAVFAMTVIRP